MLLLDLFFFLRRTNFLRSFLGSGETLPAVEWLSDEGILSAHLTKRINFSCASVISLVRPSKATELSLISAAARDGFILRRSDPSRDIGIPSALLKLADITIPLVGLVVAASSLPLLPPPLDGDITGDETNLSILAATSRLCSCCCRYCRCSFSASSQ